MVVLEELHYKLHDVVNSRQLIRDCCLRVAFVSIQCVSVFMKTVLVRLAAQTVKCVNASRVSATKSEFWAFAADRRAESTLLLYRVQTLSREALART